MDYFFEVTDRAGRNVVYTVIKAPRREAALAYLHYPLEVSVIRQLQDSNLTQEMRAEMETKEWSAT